MVSSSYLKFVSNEIFLPRKLFSLIPKPKVLPEVPVPAAALISPVGFSSIVIFKILVLFSFEITSYSTLPKIFNDFKLLIDLLNKLSLNGSPSSTS